MFVENIQKTYKTQKYVERSKSIISFKFYKSFSNLKLIQIKMKKEK